MGYRYWKRRVRCYLKYGRHGCPHIERHTRRKRQRRASPEKDGGPVRRERRVAHL